MELQEKKKPKRTYRRDALSRDIRDLFEEGLILPPATYRWPKTLADTLNAEGIITTKLVNHTLMHFSKMKLYCWTYYPSSIVRSK